jgi:hypothetical protein
MFAANQLPPQPLLLRQSLHLLAVRVRVRVRVVLHLQ